MTSDIIRWGKAVIANEAKAIEQLKSSINNDFEEACQHILACKGRIIVTGMGKSGHISRKIAATLASTGTPAYFIHPAEASHGDMGMITEQDVLIAISNSGETAEVITLLPRIKRLGIPLISITGRPESTLALAALINLDVAIKEEACPLGLTPTTSTTATLAMGDALAVTLLQARGFTSENFAFFHPGGSLGKQLLTHVEEIMRVGKAIPVVNENTFIQDALVEMNHKRMGMTTVIDNTGRLSGVYTDGDLRRTISNKHDIHSTKVADVMTANCKTIQPNMLTAEAVQMMETFKITSLVVTDNQQKPVGIVHMHDLLDQGVV